MNTPLESNQRSNAAGLSAMALLLAVWAFPAQAVVIEGTAYQETVKSGNAQLLLNGVGVRQLPTGSLYSVGLYVEKKVNSAQDLIQSRAPMQLRLVLLREISAKKLADLLAQGLMANSTDEALTPLVSEIFESSKLNRPGI